MQSKHATPRSLHHAVELRARRDSHRQRCGYLHRLWTNPRCIDRQDEEGAAVLVEMPHLRSPTKTAKVAAGFSLPAAAGLPGRPDCQQVPESVELSAVVAPAFRSGHLPDIGGYHPRGDRKSA